MDEPLPRLDYSIFFLFEKQDGELFFTMGVMYKMIRFYISTSPIGLRLATSPDTESALEIEFRKLHSKLPKENTEIPWKYQQKMAEWLVKPCIPLLRHLASENHIAEYRTLEEFINPITFALRVFNIDGELHAERCDIDPEISAEIYGYHHFEEYNLPSDNYARVSASTVQLSTGNKTNNTYNLCAEEVTLITGYKCFLKRPVLRELETYRRMDEEQNLPKGIRIACLLGLAEANDESIVGVLFTLIDRQSVLKDKIDDPHDEITCADAKKWFGQVKDIVLKLHEAKICWGSVSPANVVIDTKGNAWVVDFAGGFKPELMVSEEIEGTMEGDIEGLKLLAKYIGIKEH